VVQCSLRSSKAAPLLSAMGQKRDLATFHARRPSARLRPELLTAKIPRWERTPRDGSCSLNFERPSHAQNFRSVPRRDMIRSANQQASIKRCGGYSRSGGNTSRLLVRNNATICFRICCQRSLGLRPLRPPSRPAISTEGFLSSSPPSAYDKRGNSVVP
jgi:hypothetical protein